MHHTSAWLHPRSVNNVVNCSLLSTTEEIYKQQDTANATRSFPVQLIVEALKFVVDQALQLSIQIQLDCVSLRSSDLPFPLLKIWRGKGSEQ